MNNYDDMNQKSNMIIYTTEDGLTKIETTFDEDTVWLSIDQMAESVSYTHLTLPTT